MTRNNIIISEIFGPTIQGEGPLIGMPTLFVRTGGCDLRCNWCDSMHAVDERTHGDSWEEMTTDDVMERIVTLSKGYPMLVSLSGGNPAMQPLEELISEGHLLEYSFALETQGTIARPWFKKLDYLILSPKGPSSEMPFKEDRLAKCIELAGDGPEVSIKVVVFNDADYEFARRVRQLWPRVPFYLQAGTQPQPEGNGKLYVPEEQRLVWQRADILQRTEWLASRAHSDHWTDVRILPQLHALIWGDKRGV